jgi:competence protein ComEC
MGASNRDNGSDLPSPVLKRAWPKKRVLAWVGVATLVVSLADLGYWVHRRCWNQDFRVTVLDVGQGTAVVVEAPGGEVILVDGGGFSDTSTFDVGEKILAPFLWHNKIASVQILALTHPNSDHLNGLIYIAKNFNVREFWSNGETAQTQGYGKLRRITDREEIATLTCTDQTGPRFFGDLKVEFLYPGKDFMARIDRAPWNDSNNNSMVLKFTHGKYSVLVTGDIMAAAERELAVQAGERLHSTVLVVPHHGSRSSSTQGFLDQVKPRYGIIPCGWRNRYHFPHPSVLNRLAGYTRHVFRTDLDGAVQLVSDGRRLAITGTLGN